MADVELHDRNPKVNAADGNKKVVYLFGAGASHGSAKWSGSSTGLLMDDLAEDISDRIHQSVLDKSEYETDPLLRLINDTIDTDSDVEQIITFLEESESPEHTRLAEQLRTNFRVSLSKRLDDIAEELNMVPAKLYAVLIDLHLISDYDERLSGILTLNYDNLIEYAIDTLHGIEIDYGIHVGNNNGSGVKSILLLKLHGSFDWLSEWPITILSDTKSDIEQPLWIPPGIQKGKAKYPFNFLWGKAREILDCDVFRVVGCNLSANDWDLVSMLFRTKHGNAENRSYEIELIDKPGRAREIQRQFPYLKIKSLLELDGIGEVIVSEILGSPQQQRFDTLEDSEKEFVIAAADRKISNPFSYWLKLKVEQVYVEVGSVDTDRGLIAEFLNSN